MRIEREDLLRLDSSLGRTWLEADGAGGYAASTILLCATSRYHGLLVAPPRGGTKRHVFVSRFEETLVADGREFALSMARYGGGMLHPQGHSYVSTFELAPFPTWTYHIGDVEIRREILRVQGSGTVLVRFKLKGGDAAWTLHLRPFLPCREAGSLTFENVYLVRDVRNVPGGIAARPYVSLPAVTVTTSSPAPFVKDAHWYRGVEFADDLARGYGGHEDQFSPGRFEIEMAPGDEIVVAATIGERVADPAALWRSESRRRRGRTPIASGVRTALERCADEFLYRSPATTASPAKSGAAGRDARPADHSPSGRIGVIAGFPWFGEWGRDTSIALPGLLLARGRVEECGEALAALAKWLRRGRLPNQFGPTPETSDYAAADPSLWFALAVRRFEKAGGDAKKLYPALAEIARGLRDSKTQDVSMDDGGLLVSGPGATWMDASEGGAPATPRAGCAVEVNALWYSLLDHLGRLARSAGKPKDAREWAAMKRRAGKSFLARFWLDDERRLADVWKDGVADRRTRPNMVIAAALESSPLGRAQRAAVVACARAELLTPRGLRTLSPRDPDYRGRYEGDSRSRDAAYHQGTVWPWLVGFYAEAHLRAVGRGAAAKGHVLDLLHGFEPHLDEGAVGQIGEVFDGDAPHRAGGAWAQAWSVSELLRAWALVG